MEFDRNGRPLVNVLGGNSFRIPGNSPAEGTSTPVDLFHSQQNSRLPAPPSTPAYQLPPVDHSPVTIDVAQIQALISAMYGKAPMLPVPFVCTAPNGVSTPLRIRPAEDRFYMFIINYDVAATITVNVKPPTGVNDGVMLAASSGFWEPLKVPQEEIWVLSSGGVLAAGFLMVSANV